MAAEQEQAASPCPAFRVAVVLTAQTLKAALGRLLETAPYPHHFLIPSFSRLRQPALTRKVPVAPPILERMLVPVRALVLVQVLLPPTRTRACSTQLQCSKCSVCSVAVLVVFLEWAHSVLLPLPPQTPGHPRSGSKSSCRYVSHHTHLLVLYHGYLHSNCKIWASRPPSRTYVLCSRPVETSTLLLSTSLTAAVCSTL